MTKQKSFLSRYKAVINDFKLKVLLCSRSDAKNNIFKIIAMTYKCLVSRYLEVIIIDLI